MNDFIIVPFQVADIFKIDLREHDKQVLSLHDLAVMLSAPNSFAGTCTSDGEIVAIIGVTVLWDGVAEVYVLPGKTLPSVGFKLVRTLMRYMDAVSKTHRLHRIQTTARDDAATEKWMKTLRFTKEGDLKQFTKNKDNYCMWARYF